MSVSGFMEAQYDLNNLLLLISSDSIMNSILFCAAIFLISSPSGTFNPFYKTGLPCKLLEISAVVGRAASNLTACSNGRILKSDSHRLVDMAEFKSALNGTKQDNNDGLT